MRNENKRSKTMTVKAKFVVEKCAIQLVEICPVSRELSLALTAMEEAMIWANAAVAREEAK
jgi:hypothetical protein